MSLKPNFDFSFAPDVLGAFIFLFELFVDQWGGPPIESSRLCVRELSHNACSTNGFTNEEQKVHNVKAIFVRELEFRAKWHKHKCKRKQQSLNNESDQFWETFIDVAFVSEVKSEELSDTVKDGKHERNNNQRIRTANHYLVQTTWQKHEAVNEVEVAMIVQHHLKEPI
jgi:hypothetical protein